MKRRNVFKLAGGAIAGGGAGVLILSNAFKPKNQPEKKPQKLEYKSVKSNWMYSKLDPMETAEIAYSEYMNGSCMYSAFLCVISQLADKFGEPYASFPLQMMKYGHGGIGGFGSTCGALNGAAALIGLFVPEKKQQDILITELFGWYEKNQFPKFKPQKPILDVALPTSTSNSVLCHASNTNWCKTAGYSIKSDQRKERCRRLTADVAAKVAAMLNKFIDNEYVTSNQDDNTIGSCMTCHGKEGKLGNTGGKMNCSPCHSESLGHKVFSDIHYKLISKE